MCESEIGRAVSDVGVGDGDPEGSHARCRHNARGSAS